MRAIAAAAFSIKLMLATPLAIASLIGARHLRRRENFNGIRALGHRVIVAKAGARRNGVAGNCWGSSDRAGASSCAKFAVKAAFRTGDTIGRRREARDKWVGEPHARSSSAPLGALVEIYSLLFYHQRKLPRII